MQRLFSTVTKAFRAILMWSIVIGGLSHTVGFAVEPNADRLELTPSVRKRCIDVLQTAFRSDEFWPSMHAAEALTVAGRGSEVRATLPSMLATEKDDQKRCGLARELVRAGDRSFIPVLLKILAKADDYGHVHAAESLYKVFGIGDGRLLRRAMAQTANIKLHLMAAAALARCGNAEAMSRIRRQLASEDPDARRIAVWILARIGNESDLSALRDNLARETEPLGRCYVVNALACLGDETGSAELIKNLEHSDAAVRTYSAVFAGDARMLETAEKLQSMLDDPEIDVRVRAAQSLIALSKPVPSTDDAFVRDVYVASKEHPRYSEGSIIVLRDGSLLFATTEFTGSGSDHAPAKIIARRSTDGGRTWEEPRVIQENVGGKNVMSATLRRLSYATDGTAPVGLFYLIKNDLNDMQTALRISKDETRTFGPPVIITDRPGYNGMNNDRVTIMRSGRIVCPVWRTPDIRTQNHLVSLCYLSDDGGRTWRAGKGTVDLPKRGAMEPEVIELDDGRLLMILRNQLGVISAATSTDGGETWSEPAPWGVKAPEAPATLRRIPATGDLMLVWNHTYVPSAGHGGKRTPLTVAISSDQGKSWKHIRNLDDRTDYTFSYPSLIFHQDRALMSYYVRKESNGLISCRFASLPVESLYE